MKHNAIENEIFDAYRKQQKEIQKSIQILKKHNYKIYKNKHEEL